jgi:hypothetical protein
VEEANGSIQAVSMQAISLKKRKMRINKTNTPTKKITQMVNKADLRMEEGVIDKIREKIEKITVMVTGVLIDQLIMVVDKAEAIIAKVVAIKEEAGNLVVINIMQMLQSTTAFSHLLTLHHTHPQDAMFSWTQLHRTLIHFGPVP